MEGSPRTGRKGKATRQHPVMPLQFMVLNPLVIRETREKEVQKKKSTSRAIVETKRKPFATPALTIIFLVALPNCPLRLAAVNFLAASASTALEQAPI
jgi:hypothetical protein